VDAGSPGISGNRFDNLVVSPASSPRRRRSCPHDDVSRPFTFVGWERSYLASGPLPAGRTDQSAIAQPPGNRGLDFVEIRHRLLRLPPHHVEHEAERDHPRPGRRRSNESSRRNSAGNRRSAPDQGITYTPSSRTSTSPSGSMAAAIERGTTTAAPNTASTPMVIKPDDHPAGPAPQALSRDIARHVLRTHPAAARVPRSALPQAGDRTLPGYGARKRANSTASGTAHRGDEHDSHLPRAASATPTARAAKGPANREGHRDLRAPLRRHAGRNDIHVGRVCARLGCRPLAGPSPVPAAVPPPVTSLTPRHPGTIAHRHNQEGETAVPDPAPPYQPAQSKPMRTVCSAVCPPFGRRPAAGGPFAAGDWPAGCFAPLAWYLRGVRLGQVRVGLRPSPAGLLRRGRGDQPPAPDTGVRTAPRRRAGEGVPMAPLVR